MFGRLLKVVWRGLKAFLIWMATELAGQILAFVSLILIIAGLSSNNPWAYHPAFAICLLGPGLVALYAVLTIRSGTHKLTDRFATWVAQGFLLLLVIIFLGAYGFVLYVKIGP